MMRIKFIVAFILVFGFSARAQKIVVFVQDKEVHFADKDFLDNEYPKLKKYTSENNLKLELRQAKNGMPEGTINTPSIHFYDSKKHLVFKGRYTEEKRIQSWIKAAKFVSKNNKNVSVKNAFFGKLDNGNYSFPVKIITSHDTYFRSIKYPIARDVNDIDSIFKQPFNTLDNDFSFSDKKDVTYQTRKYYLDFYPYRTKKELFISVKIFSEFHCKIPVFETKTPLSGSYKKKEQLILEAKKLALKEIDQLIKSGNTGDAHTNFSRGDIPFISDESMGVGASEVDNVEHIFPSDLSRNWVFNSEENEGSLRFLVPNSIYTGEIDSFSVSLNLDSMQGNALAYLNSLNTGDVGLDYSITDRILADKFGVSKITLKEVLVKPDTEIKDWRPYQYRFLCDFTFAGKTVEEEIELTLAPIMNEVTREVELYGYSTFSIFMMRQFGIESGVGESEEEDTVEFYLDFKMKSK